MTSLKIVCLLWNRKQYKKKIFIVCSYSHAFLLNMTIFYRDSKLQPIYESFIG